MGMTLEESKKRLAIEKELAIQTGLNHVANGTLADAIDVAVNTMNKYQKILEIVRWNDAPSPYYKPDGQLFREICEVLEDDNI